MWGWEFTSRLSVTGKVFKICLPMPHKINITAIRHIGLSEWIEIEGIIEERQKLLSIPFSRNGNDQTRNDNTSNCITNCRKEEERKETKAETLA